MAAAAEQAAKAVQAAKAAKAATAEAKAAAAAAAKVAAELVRGEVAASEGHSMATEVRTLVWAAVARTPLEVSRTMETGHAWCSRKGFLVRPSRI